MTDDVQTILKGLRIGTLHPDGTLLTTRRTIYDTFV